MHIDIVRDPLLSTDTGTYGRLLIDNALFCVTCEQPWNNNKQGASSMPMGEYQLLPYNSPAHGHTFVFHNPKLDIYGTPALIPAGLNIKDVLQ